LEVLNYKTIEKLKLMKLSALGIVLSSILFGSNQETGAYISPGLQIGYNSHQGLFFGFQVTSGLYFERIEFDFPIGPIPAISKGYKYYPKLKKWESYTDFQLTYPTIIWKDLGYIPIGVGFGKSKYEGNTGYRLKTYIWFYSNITFDFNPKNRILNYSLIPVIPLSYHAFF